MQLVDIALFFKKNYVIHYFYLFLSQHQVMTISTPALSSKPTWTQVAMIRYMCDKVVRREDQNYLSLYDEFSRLEGVFRANLLVS